MAPAGDYRNHPNTDMDNVHSLKSIHVDGVGTCISAVEFIMGACKKTKQQAQVCMNDILKGSSKHDVAKILCRKERVPGFWDPTYVITYTCCSSCHATARRTCMPSLTDSLRRLSGATRSRH